MVGTRVAAVVIAAVTAVAVVGVVGSAPAGAAPAVVVSPSTGLLDEHVVEVDATGLVAGADHLVTQCSEGSAWQCDVSPTDEPSTRLPGSASYVTADDSGAASTRLQLRQGPDCVDFPCEVRVYALGDVEPVAVAGLEFSPEGTYTWPQADLEATFSDPSLEASEVTVTATGLDPWFPRSDDAYALVGLCRDDADLELEDDCLAVADPDDEELEARIEVAPDGTGQATFLLPRHLRLPGAYDYDCAVEGCVLVASQADGNPMTDAVPVPFGPEWAPWASAQDFVDQALVPVSGMPVPGEDFVVEAIETRQLEAAAALLAAAAASGDPGSANTEPADVARLYRTFFGRWPDSGGLRFWVARLRDGASIWSIARSFGGTSEFRARYGAAADGQVVDAAYRNTLGREPDAGGRAYWIGRLGQGLPRWGLLLHFSVSREMRNREAARVAITVLTFTLAGRAASPASWCWRAPARCRCHPAMAPTPSLRP